MKDKRHKHRHQRSARGFEAHKGRTPSRHADEQVRKGRAWRFFDARNFCLNPFEPHLRSIARTSALSGKHFRSVPEPAKAAHGKSL